MTNLWLLPDHIADVLPTQAHQLEEMRRALLDIANSYGYELVMPPLIEHLDSLLLGTGGHIDDNLDLRTFKLVDQSSGRSLGVRADTTSQVARIDAHLLNRQGVVRLCYCGSVLHTKPDTSHAGREPLQFGAEIYGCTDIQADLEVIELALTSLSKGGVRGAVISLSDVRIIEVLLAEVSLTHREKTLMYQALATKNTSDVQEFSFLSKTLKSSFLDVVNLYGGLDTLIQARQKLPDMPKITQALSDLETVANQLMADGMAAQDIQFDLADVGGYGYYTGIRFALYGLKAKEALARGGRYDEVGAVFGRKRPAVGFSLDIKALVDSIKEFAPKSAICMPCKDDHALRLMAKELRMNGESVISAFPGHENQADAFICDRELVLINGQWVIKNLSLKG